MSGIQYANFALSTLTLRLTAGRDDRQTFLSLVDVLEHPCCPIPSKPDHEVRKQTFKKLLLRPLRSQTVSARSVTFSERSENEFGVKGYKIRRRPIRQVRGTV